MSKHPNDLQLIQRFIEHYSNKFEDAPDLTRLLMNLIVDGITDPERIRNYMIICDYLESLSHNGGYVGRTFYEIAQQYDLSERQVQNIVYKWSDKFRPAQNVASKIEVSNGRILKS